MIPVCMAYVVTVSIVAGDDLRPFFVAIRAVETSGRATPNMAVGDNGRSIGPYQISVAYWKDSGIPGDWKLCHGRVYSEAVMLAYWKRHNPRALRQRNCEVLARIHNGGPTGHTKRATTAYWQKVRQAMSKKLSAQSTKRVVSFAQVHRRGTMETVRAVNRRFVVNSLASDEKPMRTRVIAKS